MKTAEEKANEFLDKNIVDLFGSPPDAAYIREVRMSIRKQRKDMYGTKLLRGRYK